MEKTITRRRLLGLTVAAPFVAMGGAVLGREKPFRLEPEEEWELTFSPEVEGLVVCVWRDGKISVSKGAEQLRPVGDNNDNNGWQKFRGKYDTRIRLRRPKPNQLEIDYVAIAEPIRE